MVDGVEVGHKGKAAELVEVPEQQSRHQKSEKERLQNKGRSGRSQMMGCGYAQRRQGKAIFRARSAFRLTTSLIISASPPCK